ncbi:MAG TPA: tetratricopeptide repeat protein, partial [Flavobacteriales bacterium]|nr:tetratricopeptide repeat protein [Flavobacteriales bacterium]
RQKAKSFLRLADLYFDDKRYPPAQQYYDSTAALLPEDHKRAEEVHIRAEVLGDLVEQLNIIAREDSLQAFSELDADEQEKRVRRLIKDREQEEEERQRAEEEARETNANAITPVKPTGPTATGAWYFYNPTQLARGVAEFKKKWGARTNDDNWRRKDKGGSALVEVVEGGEEPEDGKEDAAKEGEPEWKDPANYLKDIPKDSASLTASNERVCEALYLSGMIYKEKLKDIDNAVESFEVLNGRFEDCRYTPESHYQLYRIYLEKERTGSFIAFERKQESGYWADVILERWPDSEFARLVRDPNQLQADEASRQAEEAAYTELYDQFRQRLYVPVITACQRVITDQPRNHLLPKYQLLKAMAVGGMHETEAFRNALLEVTTKFPGTEEAKAAEAMLAALDGQAQGNTPPPPTKDEEGFTVDQGQHYFVLVFPNVGGDVSTIKARIDDFDKQYFRNTPIQITSSILDKNSQVIMLSMFQTREKAMEYYELFKTNQDLLPGINDRGYPMFAISPSNYQRFYTTKDLDGYTAFFGENYLQKQ